MIRTGRQKTTCVYLCNELVFCLWSNWDLISLQTFGPEEEQTVEVKLVSLRRHEEKISQTTQPVVS